MTQVAINNAKVLYQLSVERSEVEKVDKLFFLTPELMNTLSNPTVAEEKKIALIKRVCDLEDISETMVRFLIVMTAHKDVDLLREIFDAYYLYHDEKNHILRAKVLYAKEPDEAQKEEARKLLQDKYKDDNIIISNCVDESLLGGYKILLNGAELDCSYEGRIRQLERKLTGR